MPSIMVITDIPSPYQVELFNELASRGHIEIFVIYRRAEDRQRSWKKQALDHSAVFLDRDNNLQGICRQMDSQDLVIFAWYGSLAIQQLMYRRWYSRRPWVFWGERPGFKYPGFWGRLFRNVLLLPLSLSDRPVWSMGEWGLSGYRREFGESRACFNVPYVSDLSRFRRSVADEVSDERRLLFSGSLSQRKGVDLLARAFLEVGRRYPNVHLDIAGDGPLKSQMQQVLAPVKSQVHFHGFIEWEKLPEVYAQNQILCVPSRYDGWGLVVPEGLAAGMPVIATDRMGSALEMIDDGRNGWLVRADDESTLANALIHAASLGTDQISSMSVAARETAIAYDLPAGAERFEVACHESLVIQREGSADS